MKSIKHLNFHHLFYFWTVAKEGHLTRAANQLHISQSALSSQIKKLEEHKKIVEPELKNPKSEEDNQRLLETMKRIEKNLQIEYKKRDGIINSINGIDES